MIAPLATLFLGISVMTAAFDNPRADAAVQALGRAVATDANYAGRDWRGIALVVEIDPRKRMYGFVYEAGNAWEAETPDDFDVIAQAAALADTMTAGASGGDRWKRCLVQLTRTAGAAPELKLDFDYDGTADWTVTPANHAAMVEKLRPAGITRD